MSNAMAILVAVVVTSLVMCSAFAWGIGTELRLIRMELTRRKEATPERDESGPGV